MELFSGVLYFVILLIKKFCLNMKMNNSNAYFYIHLLGFALKKITHGILIQQTGFVAAVMWRVRGGW